MHASGERQSRETPETKAAARQENREAAHIARAKLASQRKILLADPLTS